MLVPYILRRFTRIEKSLDLGNKRILLQLFSNTEALVLRYFFCFV